MNEWLRSHFHGHVVDEFPHSFVMRASPVNFIAQGAVKKLCEVRDIDLGIGDAKSMKNIGDRYRRGYGDAKRSPPKGIRKMIIQFGIAVV